MTERSDASALRSFSATEFKRVYDETILGNGFFEEHGYYRRYRKRYLKTVQLLTELPLPRPARLLEVGGGQIALLMRGLFEDDTTVADISEDHAEAVTRFGVNHVICDLLYDDLPETNAYDIVVLCEVIEHLPIPVHLVLAKIRQWLKPGGYILLTTPNLYRLRNGLRLLLGLPLFCPFFYPERGNSLGHPLEYSADHLRWQMEQAGFDVQYVRQLQLTNAGSHVWSQITRKLVSPLLALRPVWRDSLVACGKRPNSEAPQIESTTSMDYLRHLSEHVFKSE